MNINHDLDSKIKEFPGELAYLANLLLKEIDAGKKSNAQIEELIRSEIREIVLEEESE